MNVHLRRQLSIALENVPGRLAQIGRLLADHQVNIDGLCVIDNVEQGMVRLMTSDAQAGRVALEAQGFHVIEAEVIALELTDHLGRLAAVSEELAKGGINIEYAYATVDHAGATTLLILKTSGARRAREILTALADA